MQTQSISVYLRPSHAAWFEQAADDCGLKRATFLRLVLERYVNDPQPLMARITPGRVDADEFEAAEAAVKAALAAEVETAGKPQ